MQGRLKNKVAIITGSSRGIGAAIAQAYAKEGASVIINYASNANAANNICGAIQTAGGQAAIFQADVARSEEVRAMFDFCKQTYGQLDILVNNASLEVNKSLADYEEADWDMTVDSTLKSVFLCTQQAQKLMLEKGKGSIINISSVHDVIPRIPGAPYCAAKAGLLMLTKSYALDLARDGIRVNAISPGLILTDRVGTEFTHADGSANLENSLIKKIPLHRAGLPIEICEPAIYLASDLALYTTGTTIYVDGGLSIAP